MSELKRWSGNDTTDISIEKFDFGEIIKFAKRYQSIYLFGNGHIGKAVYKYIKDSGFRIEAVLTSENIVKHVIYPDNNSGIIVGVGDSLLPEVLPVIREYFKESNIFVPDSRTRETIGNILDENLWRKEFWLNIYVTNKCNLGCKSCSAFAPICEQDFYELDSFKKDLDQVNRLGLDIINEFKFTGAEAMLHPDIIPMLEYTRKLYPEKKIEVYTNGLFIKGYKEEKLKKLADCKVVLVVTEYPVPGLDLKESYRKLDKCGVSYYVIYSEEQKFFSKRPLRFEGDVPKERYIECPRYKMCRSLFLFRGKLFKCIYAISADYVNKAFNKQLEIDKRDYVNIYNANADQVYEYATGRIPFCNYCLPIEELVPWGLSKKTIDEWA